MTTKDNNVLTREERVEIASRFLGMYTASTQLADARTSGELADIDCALDNLGVPIYRDQLAGFTSQSIWKLPPGPEKVAPPTSILIMKQEYSYITFDRPPVRYAVALRSRLDDGLELHVLNARGKVEALLRHPTVAMYVESYKRGGKAFTVLEDVDHFLHTCPPPGAPPEGASGHDFDMAVAEVGQLPPSTGGRMWAVCWTVADVEGETDRQPMRLSFVEAEGELEAAFEANVLCFESDFERHEALNSYDSLGDLVDTFRQGDADLAVVEMFP
jgi:hypothetical protein